MKAKQLKEGLADLAYKAESDHEVQMARAELYKIAKYSIKMHEMLKGVEEREGLEGWVQSKITKAADYMASVYHHMDYEQKFDEVQEAKKSKPDFLDMDKDGNKKEPMKKAIKDKKEKQTDEAYKHDRGKKKKENYKSSLEDKLKENLSSKKKTNQSLVLENFINKPITEEQFDEAAGKKDACYHKVKARYKVWPSAYASGALVQCRKKGAKNWGNSKK